MSELRQEKDHLVRHQRLAKANEKLDLSNTESNELESVGQVYNSIIQSIEQRLKNIDDRVEEVQVKISCVQAELDQVEGTDAEKFEKMREDAKLEAKKRIEIENNSPKTSKRVGRDMTRNNSNVAPAVKKVAAYTTQKIHVEQTVAAVIQSVS